MEDLNFLREARSRYERAFASLPVDLESVVTRLDDRTLGLAPNVFVAAASDRSMKITVEEEGAVPCAYLKRTGVDFEIAHLQVVVIAADLQVEACRALFEAWIVKRATQAEIEPLMANVER